MPAEVGPHGPGDTQPGAGLRDRLLVRLPHLRRREPGPNMGQRLEKAFLKPAGSKKPAAGGQAGPAQEDAAPALLADDQERLVGLSMAPLAGLIAIVVAAHQLADNPPATLSNGRPNPLHVSPALTHELEVVLLALAAAILVSSLFRRRLFTGIAAALYGLAIFNLHWWGFGIPFVFAGAWFLVRAYRAQHAVKTSTAGTGPAAGSGPAPSPSKRYTPPAATPRRARPARPRGERSPG